MSADWPIVQLGEYCSKIGSGATPRGGASVYLDAGEISLIRSQNVYNDGFRPEGLVFITPEAAGKLQNVSVEKNDVLLNITGDSVARVCLAKEQYLPARVNQHVAIIRPDSEEFDARFIRYFLASPVSQGLLLSIAAVGATRNALTKNMIETLEVPKPPLEMQQTLAEKLEALEKKIDLNRQITQTLEEMAQAVFKSWFVDFEPTRAKIKARENGQDPTRAAMAAIAGKTIDQLDTLSPERIETLTATADLFPDTLVSSELGEIPEGWTLQTLEDVITLAYGKALKKTDRVSGDFPVYGSGGITGTHEKGLVDGPGIIVGRKGTVGSLYWEDHSFYPIDTVFYALCKGPATLEYAFYLLQTLGLEGMNTDAAVPGLNRSNAYRLQLPKAPGPLIVLFSKFTSSLRAQMKSGREEISTLEQLRDTLLPKLLSGEIDVSNFKEAEE